MEAKFFKPRKKFNFTTNKYDLGTFFWAKRSHLDMHFLNKIYKLDNSEHIELYNHHERYYLESQPKAQKKEFFEKIFRLVKDEKGRFTQQDPRKISSSQKSKKESKIKRLKNFINVLKEKDKWGLFQEDHKLIIEIDKKMNSSISKQNDFNQRLDNLIKLEKLNDILEIKLKSKEKQIANLENELKTLKIFNAYKISVKESDFGTLINIIKKLIDLEDPIKAKDIRSNKLFFQTKSKNTWVKLIANHFTLEGEDITYSRVENYIIRDREPKIDTRKIKIEVLKDKIES